MAPPLTSIDDVLARLRAIDAELPADDGAAVFNHMYLTVTERVAAALAGAPVFNDPAFMTQLDVAFASLWLEAYAAATDDEPRAWAPLFECRDDRSVLPVQYAVAGMNSHIAHDLPLAVVRTCQALGTTPDTPGLHADYLAVNGLLSACEEEIRRSFLTDAGRQLDDRLEPVTHLIGSWSIDRARDAAWVRVQIMWALRGLESLTREYEQSLAHSVGFASRLLLTPTAPS